VRVTSRLVWKTRLLAFVVLTLAAASCGSSEEPTFPDDAVALRANTDLAVGKERLLLAIAQLSGTRLGAPEDGITVEVAPEDAPDRVQSVRAGFDWTIEGGFGFYRAEFDFDRPGPWLVTVIPDAGDPLETILINIADDACRASSSPVPCAPRIGEPAPSLATPTLAEATLADLTTDPSPDERLYQLSLDEVLANGRPTVVVFATPAYCSSATCGPILNEMKPVVDERPDVDFIHIEVFTGLQDPDFAPGPATVAPAVTAWSLPSEPWVFVVDANGVVTARFEGTMTSAELRDKL
jgi:hypothetical protein